MSDTFVKSFTHLKDRPKAERALPMLQRIASLVKPIMRKRSWVLPVLSEFFPDSPNLVGLNINGGEQILLRLRPAWAADTFYEEEQVVKVMLHELTHNVHGPHDEKFYKFLAGLEDEYDELKRSGYSGEGFFSKGHRLGTNVSHNVPPHLARVRALEAAEKRRKASTMLGSGGRLGGRVGTMQGMSPRELAAQAAERRKRDEVACGSGATAQKEAAKAAKESVGSKVFIDLTNDIDDFDPTTAAGPSRRTTSSSTSTVISGSNKPSEPSCGPAVRLTKSRLVGNTISGPHQKGKSSTSVGKWTCPSCTLENDPFALQCDACLSERPHEPSHGWTCVICREEDIPHEFWSCRFCGNIKAESVLA
ncbi:hypothetical protein SERLA73DRAFT_190082 [Serpula lacrymans var. lacrymans S7.3]|uniref:WLM domain-containing protein n=2 Tax=Serpula lacrymans var. lacrymans TaxID=341189 RepID=F8QF17_SERL3|nr:uncharacterized protein SERLADRAFT_455701 [Serpula lacrymans var. lacrymans S7.9]EGN93180.1 hypothetical protein SERLA73DRAFT_190082 [Serpula lacrymans var. lacrymans S7.3]EGO31079.1 hypothetical protein SERLADRAFT_455701 [Serpula lacrymans var. lacrymans S7.9]